MSDLEGEVARLTLRVNDLQQQLWGRKAERGLGVEAAGAPPLSLFAAADATLPAALTAAVFACGPTPVDPALAREVIVLPDPPAADRRCSVTGAPLVAGFAERLEVLARRAPSCFVKRYARSTSARSGSARPRVRRRRPPGRPTCCRGRAST